MKKLLLLGSALIIISACSNNSKKTLGLEETMPDEYQVTRNKSLEIPPFYKKSVNEIKQKQSTSNGLSKAERSLIKELK